MLKVIRKPRTEEWYLADGKGRSFAPVAGPFANADKARRALDRTRSLLLDKRGRQCSHI